MTLYSFLLITRHKFLSTDQIVVSNEFWRFFDAVRAFYVNSAPESNRLFGGAFIRWHSYINVTEETVDVNTLINLSALFLTRVSTLN